MMKPLNILRSLVITVGLLLPAIFVKAATITSTSAGGPWATGSTWVGSIVPVTGDDVVIATTGTGVVTLSATATCNSLVINSGATLTVNRNFTVTLTTTVSGTINFGSTSTSPRTITFTGAVTLNSGAVWNETAISAIPKFTFSESFTNNATTFTALTGVHTFAGATKTVSGSTATSIPYVAVTGTYTNNGTLTVGTSLSGAGGLTNGTTGILNLGGTTTVTTLTATSTGNLVNYYGAAQTVKATSYYNLTLSGNGTKTTTNVTVTNILSMEGTAIVSTAPTYGTSATLQYNTATARTAGAEWLATFAAMGGVKIANTGTVTMNAAKVFGASTNVPLTINTGANLATAGFGLTFHGDFFNSGTLTAGSSTITITGTTTAQSIAGFTTTGLVSMTKTGGTATFMGPVNGGGLTINGNGGTLSLGSGLSHTFSGAWIRTTGTLNGGSSTLRLGSSVTNTAGTFNANTGTVEYYASAIQTVAPLTYNNLTLSGTSAKTFPTGTTTVDGMLSMEGTATAALTGTLTYGAGAALRYKGSAAQTTGAEFPATWSGTGGVKIENAGGVTINDVRTISGASFSIGSEVSNSIFNDGGKQLNVTGTSPLFLTSGTLKLGAATATTFPAFSSNTILSGTTVEYAAAVAQTVKGLTYSNLTISGTGAKTEGSADITVNGILSLVGTYVSSTQGCLHMSAYKLNMGATATTTGTGDVTGIVKRTSFLANTPYSFGNQFTTLNFATGGTFDVSVKIVLTSSALSWMTDGIKRYYDIIQSGGNGSTSVILNLHYLFDELYGTSAEGNLDLFDDLVAGQTVTDHGHSNFNITNKWVGLANLTLSSVAQSSYDVKYWSLGASTTPSHTWIGGTSSNWSTGGNWTGGVPPGTGDRAVIPDANTTSNDPTLPTTATIGYMSIQSGGILNGGTGTFLTIDGGASAWDNLAGETGFVAGTSTVKFTNTEATISDPTNFYNLTIADGATLTLGTDNIMRIAGTLSLGVTPSGVLNASLNHNTVEYNGTAQTVVFPNGSTTGYHNLILSGSGTKTMPSSAMTIYGDFTLSGSAQANAGNDLTITGNVTLGSGTVFVPSSYSHTVSGNWTNNGATFTPTSGTVTFNSTSATQYINGTASIQNFNEILVEKTGQTLIVAGSTLTLYLNYLTINHGTLDAGTGTTINITKNWFNHGSFMPNSGTVAFNGASVQYLDGLTTFNNLTINNPISPYKSQVVLQSNITINGELNLQSANASSTQGALHTGDYTLNMGPSATTTGTGDVTGIVTRSAFAVATPYSFGNQFTTVNMSEGGTLPASMSFRIVLSTTHSFKTNAVHRYYEIIRTGGNNLTRVNLSLHYLDSELNGATAGSIDLFDFHSSGSVIESHGRSNYDATDQYVSTSNIGLTYLAPYSGFSDPYKYWTLGPASTANTCIWTGLDGSTDWNSSGNWNGGIPGSSSNVIIPDAATTDFDPSLPLSCEISTINISANGILNAVSDAQLILYGSSLAWINHGTFNPDNSTVIFANPNPTISGTTNFYNITINTGTRLATQSGAVIGIAGTMTNNGVWSTVSSGATTVNYNGGDQTVVIPDASTNRYSTLILSGTGVKTMPSEQMDIMGDFNLSGTVSTTAKQDISVSGNINIGSGTTFDASTYTLSVGGNWTNSDTFNSGTGTVILNGAAAQTITGANSFNNLTVNSAGVTAGANQSVNRELYLQSTNASATKGSLDMGSNTLTMGASATTTGTGDVTGIVKRTSFVVNTAYTFGNQFTTLTMQPGGTLPVSVSINAVLTTSHIWKINAINRYYDIAQTGGDINTKATLTLHYLTGELNGATQNNLALFDYHVSSVSPPPHVDEHGKSSENTSEQWVSLGNLAITYIAPQTTFTSKYWTLGTSTVSNFTWIGIADNDWTNTANWTGGVVPGTGNAAVIPDGASTNNDPTLPATATVGSITIQAGGVLNAPDGVTTLTVDGTKNAWNNYGTFNAGTGTVAFTGTGAVDVGGITDFYNISIASGAILTNQAASTMRIGGTVTKDGTWNASLNDNIVEYNGGTQTVLLPDDTPNYHNLILSGSGTKTMPASALYLHGEFIMSGSASATARGNITVDGTHPSLTLGPGTSFTAGSYSHSIKGNIVNNGATFTTTGSTFTFNGIIPQIISSSSGSISFNNLTISNTSANVLFGSSTDCSVGGTLTINSGSILDLSANSLTAVTGTLNNSGTFRTQSASATPVPASKTWGGTFEFYGDATQTIVTGSTFNNLTISSSGGAAAVSDITVNGILNLVAVNPSSTKGSLDMGAYVLSLGASATNIGQGDVTGIITRTIINAGVTYTYGNPFTTVFFTNVGTMPTSLSAKITIGTAPLWRTGAIMREAQIILTGGSDTKAMFSLHFLDSELNGNEEESLVFWTKWNNYEYGRSDFNSTENWVKLSNADMGLFSSIWTDETKIKNITLDVFSNTPTLTWNGSVSDSWTSVQNWTPNVGPSSERSIIIPNASTTPNDPTLPIITEINSLTIESGGILNSVASAQLTLNGSSGAWVNNGGTFNAGTSNIIFTGAAASLSGTTDFYNVSVNDQASALSMSAGSIMRIAGSFDNSGVWNAATTGSTVEYNGASQAVVDPNPASNSYYNLILSGSGTKTMPVSALIILGNLTLSGTISATAAASLTITGELAIDPGAKYIAGSFNHSVTEGVHIKSDASGDGQLINNSSTLTGTVELYLKGGSGEWGHSFHYFVPPVGSMAINNTTAGGHTASYNTALSLGLQTETFYGDLLNYIETGVTTNKNSGWQYFDGYGTPPTTPFSSLENSMGYNIYLGNNDKITFTGTLNSTEHSFRLTNTNNLTASGWNLVGNPYPCNYNLSGAAVLTGSGDNVDNTVYYTKDGAYAYYNVGTNAGTTGYSAIVPPMQGFFVRVPSAGTPTLTLPVDHKTTDAAGVLRSKGENSTEANTIEKIKLVLSNSTLSDETIVCLIDKATTGFDGDFDAYKLFGSSTTVPYIYTELNSVKYAINSLAGPASDPVRVPVTIVLSSQGDYKIDITEFENLEGIKVVLKHGVVETRLSKNTSYSFTSASGTFTDFELIIGAGTIGVESLLIEKLKTWYSNNFMYINCPDDIKTGTGSLVIYDLQGKPVYDNRQVYLTPGQTIQLPLTLPKGVYVARVIFNNQPFVSKIVVL